MQLPISNSEYKCPFYSYFSKVFFVANALAHGILLILVYFFICGKIVQHSIIYCISKWHSSLIWKDFKIIHDLAFVQIFRVKSVRIFFSAYPYIFSYFLINSTFQSIAHAWENCVSNCRISRWVYWRVL